MEKRFRIVPRGVALVIGCCTFPTWNGYPGIFASLATGNAVVVKPHPDAILPLAITVRIAREVLAEAGFDPNVVTLIAHDAGDDTRRRSRCGPRSRSSTSPAARPTAAGSRSTRARRRCTPRRPASTRSSSTPPPTSRVSRATSRSRSRSTRARCARRRRTSTCRRTASTPPTGTCRSTRSPPALAEGVDKLLGDPARAVEVLGAVQNDGVLRRLEAARSLGERRARHAARSRIRQFPRRDDPHAADRQARRSAIARRT